MATQFVSEMLIITGIFCLILAMGFISLVITIWVIGIEDNNIILERDDEYGE